MNNGKAFDLPHSKPPDSALEIASDELTCDQGLLLLEWIKNLRSQTYNCEMTKAQEVRDTCKILGEYQEGEMVEDIYWI